MNTARILLVDDYRDSLLMWATYLRLLGYEVTTAVDGESAVRSALESPPDVVVMDLVLPGLNGYEAAARLMQAPATAHVPIIATTGLTHPELLERARTLGFFSVALKPCDPPTLVREIERALSASQDDPLAAGKNTNAPSP